MHICACICIYIYIYTFIRGFHGYWFKDTVKGPQFEETATQISLNHRCIEQYQHDAFRKVNRCVFEIPENLYQHISYIMCYNMACYIISCVLTCLFETPESLNSGTCSRAIASAT